MSDDDVIWIAKLPKLDADDDGVEFAITSGKHESKFRMSRKNARKFASDILFLLDQGERRRRDNVRPIKGN